MFARTGETLFHQTGVLWLAHEGDPYPVRTFETLRNLGIPIEKLTHRELTTSISADLRLKEFRRRFLEPDSGVLLARRAVQAVVREALKSGVEYFQDSVEPPSNARTRSTSLSPAAASVFQPPFTCLRAAHGCRKIFPDVLAERIHPTRQEVFYFGAPAGMRFQSPALPTWIDFKNEAYGLPDIEGRGVKVAIDRHGDAIRSGHRRSRRQQ